MTAIEARTSRLGVNGLSDGAKRARQRSGSNASVGVSTTRTNRIHSARPTGQQNQNNAGKLWVVRSSDHGRKYEKSGDMLPISRAARGRRVKRCRGSTAAACEMVKGMAGTLPARHFSMVINCGDPYVA